MKKANFSFATATAAEIVSAIDSKITTTTNLHTFRTRAGGAAKADKLHPQTREALNIIKRLKQQARAARTIREVLSPYNGELAKGRQVLDLIKPIIGAWKEFYFSKGIGLTDDQVLLLIAIQSAGELEELTGQVIPGMTKTNY